MPEIQLSINNRHDRSRTVAVCSVIAYVLQGRTGGIGTWFRARRRRQIRSPRLDVYKRQLQDKARLAHKIEMYKAPLRYVPFDKFRKFFHTQKSLA